MTARGESDRRLLVGLFWVYFALLIGEGALRKWVLPEWSDALLIVRDPVAVVIIGLAFRTGTLTRGKPMRVFAILAVCFMALGIAQVVIGSLGSVVVLGYGLRTYFLHPPLIFIMGRVFDARDLRRAALVIIVLMLPIALLMVEQFRSASTDWINRGAGEGRLQISSAMGRIRPAGPFSFITGPVLYYGLALACLLGSHFQRDHAPAPLRWVGWGALLIAAAVSGSRALLWTLAPVVIAAALAYVLRPQLFGAMIRAAATAALVISIVWTSSAVQEGVEIFNARLRNTAGATGSFDRVRGTFEAALSAWSHAPLFGAGLGLGTNAGTALLGGRGFQLGEDEWPRVLFEAGPVLGLAYLVWRLWVSWLLLSTALQAAICGQLLPLLLFGACVANLVTGQWGQPSVQGFAVWTAGLCMAASRLVVIDLVRAQTVVEGRSSQTISWPPVAARNLR